MRSSRTHEAHLLATLLEPQGLRRLTLNDLVQMMSCV